MNLPDYPAMQRVAEPFPTKRFLGDALSAPPEETER